jgi:hypothetical protein
MKMNEKMANASRKPALRRGENAQLCRATVPHKNVTGDEKRRSPQIVALVRRTVQIERAIWRNLIRKLIAEIERGTDRARDR